MSYPILITGGARRIGLHCAQKLKEQGYDVMVHYRTPCELPKGILGLQADFTKEDSVDDLINNIYKQTKGLRAIIHNASLYETTDEHNISHALQQFDQFYQVHLRAPYHLSRACLPLLQQSTPADIIHITDIYAERPTAEHETYCATKAGLQALTQSLAKKWAPRVKVNAIAPGPVLFMDSHTTEYREKVISQTPLKKEGSPEHIYQAIHYILEQPYMTGATLPVDGGRRLQL